jgi:hypothetical protein
MTERCEQLSALVANISAMRDDRFLASFIGAEAPTRMPAARVFDTLEAARDWITEEASAVQLQIRWQSAGRSKSAIAAVSVHKRNESPR